MKTHNLNCAFVWLILAASAGTLSTSANAQFATEDSTAIEGKWEITFQFAVDQSTTMPVSISVNESEITLVANMNGQDAEIKAALEDDKLTFLFVTGHGEFPCTLYRQSSDEYSGVCSGPQGEVPTLLDRVEE